MSTAAKVYFVALMFCILFWIAVVVFIKTNI
jgi:hypothetical protein